MKITWKSRYGNIEVKYLSEEGAVQRLAFLNKAEGLCQKLAPTDSGGVRFSNLAAA